ncbi:MAG: hypothetical protein MUO99_00310 [Dehalococcoidales bacterium]|nr:hypothetical protein [Dehalococcoidales bacterium]
MKRKIISILLMLVISLTTLWIPNSGEIAVADTCEEATIDYKWVYGIVENLSRIIKDPNLKTNGIYLGRDFASVGEREAARRIKGWMENNTRNLLNCTINMYPVGNDAYDGEISNKIIQAGSNNKIDILRYSLEFKNTTHTATIPNNESFPVPKFILTSGKDIITGWNKVKLMDEDDIKDEISQDTELSYALMNENTPVPGGFGGEIVIIDDYSSASENETAGKIHLLEFMTNESEDVYLKKIQNVVDSDGLGFIFVSTNPSFIKNLSTSIFGVAISSHDALKIKNHLNNNQGVVAYFSHEPSLQQSGSFAIGAYPECIGEKYIGLIEEHSHGFPLSNMSDLCFKPVKYSKYVGYLLFNKTNPGTHYLLTPSFIPYENWYSGTYIYLYAGPVMYSTYIFKAFMTVNGTISLNNGVPINIWDWANDSSLQANFSIEEQRNSEAESYNVICEVEGKNKSKSILISGGHHVPAPGYP